MVDVPDILRPMLLEQAEDKDAFDLLFANFDGSMHTRSWLLAAVNRVCKKANVTRVCPHALRGTYATLALQVGMGSRQVADALGHENTRTTLRHYAGAGSAEAGEQRRTLLRLEGRKTSARLDGITAG